MKLKKYIKIIPLFLAMIMLLCACAGESATSSQTEDTSSLPGEEDTVGSAKVGYVYDRTVGYDNYTSMFEKSRRDIEIALEIDTAYVENVSVSQFEDAVKALKNEGCNIIISTSNAYANAAYKYAKDDPEIFMLSYGGEHALSNLTAFQPKLYQTAFLSGTVAAWNSESHKIGIVCDDNMFASIPVIDAFIVGVQQIYKSDETDVRIVYANTDAETEKGVNKLKSEGCDVIFSYQPTDYAMYYCDSLGIESIGFTSDVEYSAPKKGLMGFYLNWATYITDTVRTCINDNFNSGIFVGGINEAFIKITPYTDSCKDDTDTITDTLYDYVKRGNAKIFEGEIRDKSGIPRVGNNIVLTHSEIMKIDYLFYGATYAENLIQPIDKPITSDLTVKTDFLQ